MSKFRLNSKVIITAFYKDYSTRTEFNIEELAREPDIARSISDVVPSIVTAYRCSDGISYYTVKLFSGREKEFFEDELRLAKVDNWKKEISSE